MADVLVIGQGLAGTLLSWRLIKAGVCVKLVDTPLAGAAKHAAPGLLNPLAGKKLQPAEGVRKLLDKGAETFDALLQETGQQWFHQIPMRRILVSPDQARMLQQLLQSRDADFVGQVFPETPDVPDAGSLPLREPFGSFVTRHSGWFDVPACCDWFRQRWKTAGMLEETLFKPEALMLSGAGATYQGKVFRHVVLAEGWRGASNPWFGRLPWKPARGDVLKLVWDGAGECPVELESYILNAGTWLVPLGKGVFRAGSTYSWSDFEAAASPQKQAVILAGLRSFVNGRFRVMDHSTAVRPVLSDYLPAIGPHSRHPALLLCNGLASKGVLFAPWATEKLAAYIVQGSALPNDISVARFLK